MFKSVNMSKPTGEQKRDFWKKIPQGFEEAHFLAVYNADHLNLFEDESSKDIEYCKEEADFKHRIACEFIFYMHAEKEGFDCMMENMVQYGCSEKFIECFKEARSQGALWVLIHAD